MTRSKTVVWHLCSNRWHSAVTEYALSACEATSELGFSSVFVGKSLSPGLKQAIQRGIAAVAVESFSGVCGIRSMANIGISQSDYIFTYGGPETTAAQLLSLGRKRYRVRADPMRGVSSKIFCGEYWSRINIDGVIYPSRALRKNPESKLNSYEKIIVLGRPPNFSFNNNENIVLSRPELLIVGRLDPIKGHLETIKLFNELCRSHDKLRRPKLTIIGEPKNISQSQLMGLVRELKLDDDFDLITERVPNIEERMARATVGMIPSLGSEYICRVAEEFLLCGTPIIVSGVGALKETLFEGAGLCYEGLSEPEKITAISEYLKACFAETSIERSARAKRAGDYFSLTQMAKELEPLLI